MIYIAYGYGFGKHALALGLRKVIINVKLLFAYEVLCTLCIYAIKLSILLFYRRIFPTSRFQKVVVSSAVILGFIYLAFLVTFFAQCIPLNYLWDRSIKDGVCIDVVLLMRVTAIVNMASDIIILLMPMPVIWRLPQLSLGQKLGISAMFCLGGFLVRIFVLSQVSETDPTWSDFNGAAWTYAEACIGILSACLPMIRPLFTTFLWKRIRSAVSDRRSTANKGSKSEGSRGTWPSEDKPPGSGESTTVNSEDSRSSWPRIIVTSPGGSEEQSGGELRRWKSTGKIGALESSKTEMTNRDCRRVKSLLPLDNVHVEKDVVDWVDCERGEEDEAEGYDEGHDTSITVQQQLPSETERRANHRTTNRESRGPAWPLSNDGIIEDASGGGGEVETSTTTTVDNVEKWRSSTTPQYSKTVGLAPLEKAYKKRWITRGSYDPVQNLLPLNATDVQKMVEWAEDGKRRSK
ncbi:MAG: hypothetical protein M1816_006682 [Peltula sp. TS41687]|nr:MAG: hypothetical protein M1816_006682 [Peltula sp. TS41687]